MKKPEKEIKKSNPLFNKCCSPVPEFQNMVGIQSMYAQGLCNPNTFKNIGDHCIKNEGYKE